VPKAVQTKFAPIIHPSISNHCVDVQVSYTKLCLVLGSFFELVIIPQVVVIGVIGGVVGGLDI